MINQQMIDLEKTMNLLDESASIKDSDESVEFSPKDGSIKFEHVYFSYDVRETALVDLTFEVKPGTR
jgi:ABC-type transport system involved in Fe-S cluster assembly fused permease/ATPase subunit